MNSASEQLPPDSSRIPLQSADSLRNGRRLCGWAIAGTLTLTIVDAALYMAFRQWPTALMLECYVDWGIGLPVLHVLGMAALLWRQGLPRTVRDGACLVLLNGWLLALEITHR